MAYSILYGFINAIWTLRVHGFAYRTHTRSICFLGFTIEHIRVLRAFWEEHIRDLYMYGGIEHKKHKRTHLEHIVFLRVFRSKYIQEKQFV